MNLLSIRMLMIALAALGGLGMFGVWRFQIRQTAKNEVVQQITTQEIDKLKKTTNAQDRTRRDHLRSPDRLREHNDGYRRD
ncbi:hypothetical protein [Bosea sp. TAF32]|uniref:hypothetical protein n=1 Tax=Bosea sp. TAF32 TaxID=3237482 RepID=UPI003F92F8F1